MENAKSLPPPSVKPRSKAPMLRGWILQIQLELYYQSKGGSVSLSLPSLQEENTTTKQV